MAAPQVAPRAPLSALAEVLGSSAGTVGRRLTRLGEERLLRVIGQVEWPMPAEGNPMHLWVATAPGQAWQVARRLSELPEIPFVATTTGRTDVYCSLHATRRDRARELLMTRIPSVPGVRSAHTELVLRATAKSDSWREQCAQAEEGAAQSAPGHSPGGGPSHSRTSTSSPTASFPARVTENWQPNRVAPSGLRR